MKSTRYFDQSENTINSLSFEDIPLELITEIVLLHSDDLIGTVSSLILVSKLYYHHFINPQIGEKSQGLSHQTETSMLKRIEEDFSESVVVKKNVFEKRSQLIQVTTDNVKHDESDNKPLQARYEYFKLFNYYKAKATINTTGSIRSLSKKPLGLKKNRALGLRRVSSSHQGIKELHVSLKHDPSFIKTAYRDFLYSMLLERADIFINNIDAEVKTNKNLILTLAQTTVAWLNDFQIRSETLNQTLIKWLNRIFYSLVNAYCYINKNYKELNSNTEFMDTMAKLIEIANLSDQSCHHLMKNTHTDLLENHKYLLLRSIHYKPGFLFKKMAYIDTNIISEVNLATMMLTFIRIRSWHETFHNLGYVKRVHTEGSSNEMDMTIDLMKHEPDSISLFIKKLFLEIGPLKNTKLEFHHNFNHLLAKLIKVDIKFLTELCRLIISEGRQDLSVINRVSLINALLEQLYYLNAEKPLTIINFDSIESITDFRQTIKGYEFFLNDKFIEPDVALFFINRTPSTILQPSLFTANSQEPLSGLVEEPQICVKKWDSRS